MINKIDESYSLEQQVWTKLKLLPPAQQQMILSFIEFLLSQVNQQNQDNTPDEQQSFLETCGGWQDDPRTAEALVEEIYSVRTISSQE
ncbi:MAG: DUF2281 domain-containing protein [Symploca sp. SIO2G7]|nr:DUF2281 domain-containing protein [Symploca sp. SIO2G7]